MDEAINLKENIMYTIEDNKIVNKETVEISNVITSAEISEQIEALEAAQKNNQEAIDKLKSGYKEVVELEKKIGG